MRNFKLASQLLSAFATHSLLGLTMCLSIGCTLPQPQNRESDSASFTVDLKEPKFTESKSMTGFSIPESKTLHIEACVKDLKAQKPIINHRFSVSGDQKSVDLITDASGCLNWDETVHFNFFADAKFVALERSLEAKGLQKGLRTVRLAINPWENFAQDLEKAKIENLVSAQNAKAALENTDLSSPKSILASDLRVSITEKQTTTAGGLTLNLEIRGTPSIEIKKSSGELSLMPIVSGQFEAQVFLIHTVAKGNSEVRTEVGRSELIPVKTVDGQISLRTPITLPPNCVRGQYQLGFKLRAIPSGQNSRNIDQLKTFEGVYYLSECDQIKGNFFAVLTNEASQRKKSFSIENYIKETPELKENISSAAINSQLPAEGFQKMGYEFSKVTVADYAYSNREPIHREREFLLRTCVFSGLDGKPLRAQNFTITKANGTTESNIRSSNQGCIEWKDSVAFNYFDQECKRPYSIQITNKELGVDKTIPLLINPWSSNPSAIEDISTTKMQPRCASGQAELRANQFEFLKSHFNYSVDSFLNLKVQKTGVISIVLNLKRPSLTEPSGFEEGSAPYGKYKLKVALVDSEADPSGDLRNKAFMVSEKEITLSAQGSLVDELTLEAITLKEMGNSNKLWLELTPIDTSTNLRQLTFQGSLRFADDTASGNLRELSKPEGVISLVEKAKTALAQDQLERSKLLEKAASKLQTAKELGLELVNLNSASEIQTLGHRLSAQGEALRQWLQTSTMSQNLAKQLCLTWINEKIQPFSNFSAMAALRECMMGVTAGPEKYFDIQYRYFAKNPQVPSAQQESIQMQDFTMSNAFNNGSSFVNSHTTNDAVDFGFGISTGKWFGLSASSGYRHSVSWAKQWGTQQATNQSTTGSIALKTERIALKIRAESLEKCAVIKLRPESFMAADSNLSQALSPKLTPLQKLKTLNAGYLFCSGEQSKTPMVFTENYYIMNQFFVGAQASDTATNKNRPYFIALRGDEDFAEFISLVHEGTNIPDSYLGDFQRRDLLKGRYTNLFLKGLPGSPGQFISPR